MISGVRSDLGIMVYGDDMDVLLNTGNKVASVVNGISGSSEVKVEQVTGLPMLTVNIDRQAISRYGLDVAKVQEAVEIAIGGKEAGTVYEGDVRSPLVVRLPEKIRHDLDSIRRLPIPVTSTAPADEFDNLVALAGGIREAFARGALHLFVTEKFMRRLAEQGTPMHVYRVPRNGSVNCTLLPEERYVVARLEVPLEGVVRVDAAFEIEGQSLTYHDVPFDAEGGTVVVVPRAATLREMPSHRAHLRLVAVEGGTERELGTCTFHHTRYTA